MVSYVINNGPRPVSDGTRARVLEVIEELGYYPHPAARSLRLAQSFFVGLITPDITNPVYSEVAKGMEEILSGAGRLLMLADSADDPVSEGEHLEKLRQRHVDGVVLIPTGDPGVAVEPLLAGGIPVVVLEQRLPGVPCIVVDESAAVREATEFLLALGHRRIGLLRGTPDHRLSRHRFDGYAQALDKANIPFDASLVKDPKPGPGGSAEASLEMLAGAARPTAILAHNDLYALEAIHAAWRLNLRVPEDVSVIGYDDISIAPYITPPLTTVSFPHREMGRQAGRILLEASQNTWDDTRNPIVLRHELVVRGSTAPPSPRSS